MHLLINDLHQYGPHQIYKDPEEVFRGIAKFRICYPEGKVVANGDNGDRKGAKHGQDWAVIAFNQRLKAACDLYNYGNHELEFEKDQFCAIAPGHGATHGHWAFWPRSKIDKWAKKTPGRGTFMRSLSWAYSYWRLLKQPKITDEHMERAIEICKARGWHTLHTGHRHSRKIIRRTVGGISLVSYPRGMNLVVV